MPEEDIRALCYVARDIFLDQPCLLQLATPIKICGEAVWQGREGRRGYLAEHQLSKFPCISHRRGGAEELREVNARHDSAWQQHWIRELLTLFSGGEEFSKKCILCVCVC